MYTIPVMLWLRINFQHKSNHNNIFSCFDLISRWCNFWLLGVVQIFIDKYMAIGPHLKTTLLRLTLISDKRARTVRITELTNNSPHA